MCPETAIGGRPGDVSPRAHYRHSSAGVEDSWGGRPSRTCVEGKGLKSDLKCGGVVGGESHPRKTGMDRWQQTRLMKTRATAVKSRGP